jgi:polysaccharide export outer membrane protein
MDPARTPDRVPEPPTRFARWRRAALALALLVVAAPLGGCEIDSFFNPSITGYWEHTPTTIPILERIDVIEQEDDFWGQTSDPGPEDLVPNDLTYRVAPGDVITVGIYELQATGTWSQVVRRVDAGGSIRVPEVGEIQAAGRTAQEIEDALKVILRDAFVTEAQVDVNIEQGGGFNYTLYGAIPGPGLYTLLNPDLRLIDALATAGGVPLGVENIFVIRQVALTEDVKPFTRDEPFLDAPPPPDSEPVDIEGLIDQLDDVIDPGNDVRPGAFAQDGDPPIDVDDLTAPPPAIDIDRITTENAPGQGTWMFVEERGEWVRVPGAGGDVPAAPAAGEEALFLERVIKIPAERLTRGDSRYNIVVRPKDRIFLEPPPSGVVYIDGQINRPGTFNLPSSGLTLSRLVAAAGGLGQLAIPERVDLIRIVGDNREAAIRLNLGAIRQRTEPDVLLKPDDHIIIGTSWAAVPLAVIRNGFRATYGFGFLLDRNFGNDVFGAPPSNVGNR